MPAGVKIPTRDLINGTPPATRVRAFAEKIHEKLIADNEERMAKHIPSGKVSGGKLSRPLLWNVLSLIGVPDQIDAFLLGKFVRGNDVEERAIKFLTGIDASKVADNTPVEAEPGNVLTGTFTFQKPGSYRGGVGYIDMAQQVGDTMVYHEIKSVTKMAYQRVDREDQPYYHHAIQLAYYCLGDNVSEAYLQYLNADDYRVASFKINPLEYKEEIDKEIDDLKTVFITKKLPPFVALLDMHKVKLYRQYEDWNWLTPDQMMDKLQNQFPEQYKRFMEMTIDD